MVAVVGVIACGELEGKRLWEFVHPDDIEPMREFLVFNQEMATLLKAGMPLAQSLDLLKRALL